MQCQFLKLQTSSQCQMETFTTFRDIRGSRFSSVSYRNQGKEINARIKNIEENVSEET